jgi:hypothetical protein
MEITAQDQRQPSPIQIFVSYPWPRDEVESKSVRGDTRWQELRDLIDGVAADVKKRAAGRSPSERTLDIRINRLRGLHGQHLLDTLRQRIGYGDVLVMDIGNRACTGLNSNVLIELGIAIGLGKLESGGLFVLKPAEQNIPSDLAGFLATDYTIAERKLRLVDKPGFTAALRTKLIAFAEQRGMIGPKKSASIEIEGEDTK